MSSKISFMRDQWGGPSFEAVGHHYNALGSMLTSDVQNDTVSCLDNLAWLEEVRQGQAERHGWQGNSWHVLVSKDGMRLEDLYSDDWRETYPLDEAHEIILGYLRFLAPGVDGVNAGLARWEKEYGQTHPCRNHL
ncbi:hypothetical protein [Spirillospora sp. NPDC047279]|uniref:hypothetical protein n=1 Tax=Spirillospora sp. NPDC047279 TaxID=3155478 RepID=UPI0033E6BBA4